MPKPRIRKTERAKWSVEHLNAAKRLYEQGEISMRAAAKRFEIPFSTLQERIKKKKMVTPTLGRNTVFTREQEEEMANQIKYLASIFYGCTNKEVRRMAFQYAEKNGINHNFNTELKLAGRDWLIAFQKRNQISIRKAEATSLNRATAFNKEEVNRFYELLQQVNEKNNFSPRNIYNVDETGISTVQDPGKVLAAKGQKRVGSMTSWERGRNITVVCAMSAAGGFIPPMFIFPRQRHSSLLEKDGPIAAAYECSKNGWITEELFVKWLKHFVVHAKPSESDKVLLILDNHSSHVSLAAYDFCRGNNITMLSIPPHTSHRTQPLDVSFYGPLKSYYRNECNLYMKSHAGEKISPYEVASLFRKAFANAASVGKGEAGFKATGIYPFNPHVFKDEDFLAAEALNDPKEITVFSNENEINLDDDIAQDIGPGQEVTGCSKQRYSSENIVSATPSTSKPLFSLNCTVEDLLPKPKKTTRVEKPNRRPKQHSTILTSTPLKDLLQEKEFKKNEKLEKNKGKTNKGKGLKDAKRNIIDSLDKSSIEEPKIADITTRKKLRTKLSKKQTESSSESDIDMEICSDSENHETDLNVCLVCNDYGPNSEVWYRCTTCGQWAHQLCSGKDTPRGYICDFCV